MRHSAVSVPLRRRATGFFFGSSQLAGPNFHFFNLRMVAVPHPHNSEYHFASDVPEATTEQDNVVSDLYSES